MIRLSHAQIGETIDLGSVAVDATTLERYWGAVGLPVPAGQSRLPLGLALALRGGPRPAVELAAGTVSVHAGHTIVAHQPFVAGRRYRVLARIAEVFEKSGRSGPLTVIVRTAELHEERSDAVVVAIREQQIARWRRSAVTPRPVVAHHAERAAGGDGPEHPLDIGSTIGIERRHAPDATTVQSYAGSLDGPEPLFSDRQFAHQLGFADVIVPGPMQSALFEGMLARHLTQWGLSAISLSFRVSVIAAEPITLSALVTEISPRHGRLVADLTLENSSGDRAAVGTATLVALASPVG